LARERAVSPPALMSTPGRGERFPQYERLGAEMCRQEWDAYLPRWLQFAIVFVCAERFVRQP
jgi:hypothetical protein